MAWLAGHIMYRYRYIYRCRILFCIELFINIVLTKMLMCFYTPRVCHMVPRSHRYRYHDTGRGSISLWRWSRGRSEAVVLRPRSESGHGCNGCRERHGCEVRVVHYSRGRGRDRGWGWLRQRLIQGMSQWYQRECAQEVERQVAEPLPLSGHLRGCQLADAMRALVL
jgi:hypothetical protein